jgi:uncharacterized protein YpmS
MTHDFWFWAFLCVLALLVVHMVLSTMAAKLAQDAVNGWERSNKALKDFQDLEKLARAIDEWNKTK